MVVAQASRDGPPAPLVIFSGGTGTSGFAVELVRHLSPVTFLANAYDDGKSTGRIRDHLGVLGPSDPAKLLTTLCVSGSAPGLQPVLASRLPAAGASLRRLRSVFVGTGVESSLEAELLTCVDAFVGAVSEVRDHAFEAGDLAVRNAVLVGAACRSGGLQSGIDHLVGLLGIPAEIVVASEQPARLTAQLADGGTLEREADIADGRRRAPITRVAIVPELVAAEPPCPASLSSRAVTAVAAARAVLYGPGTLFSSIVPSVLLLGSVLKRASCPKVLIANLVQEDDPVTIGESITALAVAGAGYGPAPSSVSSFVTDVLVDVALPGVGPAGRGWPSSIGVVAPEVVVHRALVRDRRRGDRHDADRLIDELAALLPSLRREPARG